MKNEVTTTSSVLNDIEQAIFDAAASGSPSFRAELVSKLRECIEKLEDSTS